MKNGVICSAGSKDDLENCKQKTPYSSEYKRLGKERMAILRKAYLNCDKKEEIADYIIKYMHHGVTVDSVIGYYTGDEKTMIHTVCKRIEAVKLRSKIKEIDPHSFIIITTSSEIIGRGFRSI